MIGKLDRDEAEEKRCYDSAYGKKYPSYRKGVEAGKRDAKHDAHKREQNPFLIPIEIQKLLRQRARWFMGYEEGWRRAKLSKGKKKKKVKK